MIYLRSVLLALCIILSFHASFANAGKPEKHFLLLNNNKIIAGEIITFDDGFLYFKQTTRILKISPAHFKGIFNSSKDAEVAITKLDTLNASGDSVPKIKLDVTYKQAKKLIHSETSDEELEKLLQEVQVKLTDPTHILDKDVYKKLSLLSALSSHQDLDKRLPIILNECINEKSLKDVSAKVREEIEVRVEMLYYLIDHPYINKDKDSY